MVILTIEQYYCIRGAYIIKWEIKLSIAVFRSTASGAVPKTTKIDEEKTKSLSRTYHTIKDMISSRFGPNRKDVEPEPEASLNNVTEELRKSSRSIDDDDARKKEGIYGKPRVQEPSVNVQQYSKNAYGKLDTMPSKMLIGQLSALRHDAQRGAVN